MPETIEKQKQTKLKKYGDPFYRNVKKAKQTLKKNFGKYSNFFPHFSLISQELFSEIEKCIPYKCLYATNGKEKNNEFQNIYFQVLSHVVF